MRHLVWHKQSDAHARAVNARRNEHEPGGGWTIHDHNYYEIFWIESGRLRHRWDDDEETLETGDAVALIPGETHSAEVIGTRPARVINISAGAKAVQRLQQRYAREQLPSPWHGEREDRRLLIPASERAQLAPLIALVDNTRASGRDLLLLALGHALARIRTDVSAQLPFWLRRALAVELAEGDGRLTVQALAERCRCSREHLHRIARRHCGASITSVLRDHRLDLAAADLRSSEDTIAVIAARYRFGSAGWFHEAFAERFKTTPHRYRHRYRLD